MDARIAERNNSNRLTDINNNVHGNWYGSRRLFKYADRYSNGNWYTDRNSNSQQPDHLHRGQHHAHRQRRNYIHLDAWLIERHSCNRLTDINNNLHGNGNGAWRMHEYTNCNCNCNRFTDSYSNSRQRFCLQRQQYHAYRQRRNYIFLDAGFTERHNRNCITDFNDNLHGNRNSSGRMHKHADSHGYGKFTSDSDNVSVCHDNLCRKLGNNYQLGRFKLFVDARLHDRFFCCRYTVKHHHVYGYRNGCKRLHKYRDKNDQRCCLAQRNGNCFQQYNLHRRKHHTYSIRGKHISLESRFDEWGRGNRIANRNHNLHGNRFERYLHQYIYHYGNGDQHTDSYGNRFQPEYLRQRQRNAYSRRRHHVRLDAGFVKRFIGDRLAIIHNDIHGNGNRSRWLLEYRNHHDNGSFPTHGRRYRIECHNLRWRQHNTHRFGREHVQLDAGLAERNKRNSNAGILNCIYCNGDRHKRLHKHIHCYGERKPAAHGIAHFAADHDLSC